MAIYNGVIKEKNITCLFLIDPYRYRCTIWAGSVKLRTMIDKNEDRLVKRVKDWLDTLEAIRLEKLGVK